jgi:hypothetical protein
VVQAQIKLLQAQKKFSMKKTVINEKKKFVSLPSAIRQTILATTCQQKSIFQVKTLFSVVHFRVLFVVYS